jgi:hypothetical protein
MRRLTLRSSGLPSVSLNLNVSQTIAKECHVTAVAESRLKGNYGAATVMARLSAECLVRPVAVDTDIGVDLYCETVAEGRPFLHFWLQVKAGDQCRVGRDSAKASCSFKIDHLAYWLRQPVPVFAALVPTAWPVSSEPNIYIVDITTQLLATLPPASQQELTLASSYHWLPGSPEPVRAFLTDVVPQTTARLQVPRGVVAASPTPTPTYVNTTPFVPVMRFMLQIQNQLRLTAAHSILFALSPGSGPPAPDVLAFCRRLASIVERLEDDEDLHWENFMARALAAHADGKYKRAVDIYNSAQRCIEADHHVRDDPQWQQRVRWIERLQACARKQRPLHEAG